MKRWVLVLVIGFGFLGVCLMWATEDSSVIKCGTKIMSYGDLCESTEGGRTVRTETYDEMKAGAEVRERVFRDHGLWVAGVGVALTGLGATMLIRRQRRRASAVAAAGQDGRPAFAQQPGFPQQQGNHHQPYVQQFPPQQPQLQWQQPYSQSAGWPPQPPQGGPQQFGQPQQQFGPQPQPQQFGPRGQ